MMKEEIDEFENDKEVQKWRKEDAEFNKMIDDSVNIITSAFKATKSSHKNLKAFLLHKNITNPFVWASYEGAFNNRKFYCVFFITTQLFAQQEEEVPAPIIILPVL
jgi:hypothetical protein